MTIGIRLSWREGLYQLLGKLMWEFAATQTQTAGDAHEKNTCNHADPCCGYSDIWPPRLHDLMNPMLKNCLAHCRKPYVRTDAGNIHLGCLTLQICMGSPRLSAKATQRQKHVFNSWCSPSCTSRRNSLELILATFIWIALNCKICVGSPRLAAKATQPQKHVFHNFCSPPCTSRRN